MDLTQLLTGGPVFALIGVLATVLINYLIQVRKGDSELHVVERKTLSDDQEKFKQSLLTELKDCRSTIDKLTKESVQWQEKALAIQEQKLTLTQEVIILTQRIMELEKTIEELQEHDKRES